MIWDTEEPCIIKIRIILMDQQEHIHIISAGTVSIKPIQLSVRIS
jgi:hypothetical protein